MRFLFVLVVALASLGIPQPAHAQICPVPGIPCGTDLGLYLSTRLGGSITVALSGILTAMLIFYAIKLLIASNDENQVTESRLAYLHALFGVILVTAAVTLGGAVAGGGGLNAAPVNAVLFNVIDFFLGAVGTALLANIVFNGARLITAQDDSGSSNARTGLIRGVFGVTIVLLAGTAVNAFDGSDAGTLATEVAGFGSFVATILGALAVISIIIAGIFLVVSADEQNKDRARRIVITAAVTLIVVISSVGILNLFV